MKEFEVEVKHWSGCLGLFPPEAELMRRLCQPQVRPIIEGMLMMMIRPIPEVQMIKRSLVISKLKMKSDSEEANFIRQPKNGEIVTLEKKCVILGEEIQKKKAQLSALNRRIESLKREIKQKYRRTSSLQYEICEIKKLTLTVTLVSQQLVKNLQQQCDSNCIALELKNIREDQQPPPSETTTTTTTTTTSIVNMFVATQENAVMNLMMSDVSALPETIADTRLHFEQVELKVQNLVMWKQKEDYNSQLDVTIDCLVRCVTQALAYSINKEMVREWARFHVTSKTSDVLYTTLKVVISAHSNSLCSDRDYLRVVLLNAERKLEALGESYKSVQKEIKQLVEDLSHSWCSIQEAAEKARRKRSQLEVCCKGALICVSELTDKLILAVAAELQALHKTMMSLVMRDTTEQELLDFGTIHNDLCYMDSLVAHKRMARHVILSLPKMFIYSDDPRVGHVISVNFDATCEPVRNNKLLNICEWSRHMDTLLPNNDQLIHSLSDLITVWWQPPFESAVPEDLVVSGKNILQHSAHWDRVMTFLKESK